MRTFLESKGQLGEHPSLERNNFQCRDVTLVDLNRMLVQSSVPFCLTEHDLVIMVQEITYLTCGGHARKQKKGVVYCVFETSRFITSSFLILADVLFSPKVLT